jgi:hypothetical protein
MSPAAAGATVLWAATSAESTGRSSLCNHTDAPAGVAAQQPSKAQNIPASGPTQGVATAHAFQELSSGGTGKPFTEPAIRSHDILQAGQCLIARLGVTKPGDVVGNAQVHHPEHAVANHLKVKAINVLP